MKQMATIVFCSLFLLASNLDAQVTFPSPSPAQTIRQEFGLGTIEISYSRPSAKGRRVFGDLVPYGKLWRTGANRATRLVFSDPVEINGRKLDSGSYAVIHHPGLRNLGGDHQQGNRKYGYGRVQRVRGCDPFKVDPVKTKAKTETFTILLENIRPDSCELNLVWEKKSILIPITVNVKEKIRAQIDAAMLTDKKPYWQAAQFYNEYDRNYTRALEQVNKAISVNRTAYWMYLYKAKIQQETGDNAGAMESSKMSLELAKQAKNDDFVLMNEKLQKALKNSRHE
jgi:hypothetical protein